jgi:hypothetical protein
MQTFRLVFAKLAASDSLLERTLPWLSGLLLALWPAGVLHSVRLGNDPLLYFFFAAAIYGVSAWFVRGGRKNFWLATWFIIAAMLTKMNGALLLPLFGFLIVWKSLLGEVHFTKGNLMAFGLAGLLSVGALGFVLYPGWALQESGQREKLYVDNIDHVSSKLRVGDRLENFVWFDLKTFVTEPFTSPWDDRYGRQYFLNYQGKTGLFGEWSYSGEWAHNVAVGISVLALFLAGVVIMAFCRMPKEDLRALWPMWLSAFLLIAGVAYMRWTFPVNIDFRYVLPVLIPFCCLYNYGLLLWERRGAVRLVRFGVCVELLFSLLSALFILGLAHI